MISLKTMQYTEKGLHHTVGSSKWISSFSHVCWYNTLYLQFWLLWFWCHFDKKMSLSKSTHNIVCRMLFWHTAPTSISILWKQIFHQSYYVPKVKEYLRQTTSELKTVEFNNLYKSFRYYFVILFLSTKYTCNSWSLRSTPHSLVIVYYKHRFLYYLSFLNTPSLFHLSRKLTQLLQFFCHNHLKIMSVPECFAIIVHFNFSSFITFPIQFYCCYTVCKMLYLQMPS
jgi:hypothetical protein